ncbi:MAG: PilC/PilY family type IV pilus protein [Desulfobacteraceae bacterium]
MADDTAIYGKTVTVPPNVLIILDNSGSMTTVDVPGDPYDKDKIYYDLVRSGYSKMTTKKVYYKSRERDPWSTLINNVDDISCTSKLKSDLLSLGYATYSDGIGIGLKWNGTLNCTSTSKPIVRLGNFINYENSTVAVLPRYSVARDAVVALLKGPDGTGSPNKKFGLMVFNNNQGGKILTDAGICKDCTTEAEIKAHNLKIATDKVAPMTASNFNTWTPLAETLAEAGLYFAGKTSWFNSNTTYTSPMKYSCQNNYILLVTDGEPTEDVDIYVKQIDQGKSYIANKNIFDYYKLDSDSKSDTQTSLLNDVASLLFNEDILEDNKDNNITYGTQRINTYTVGFATDNLTAAGERANKLLTLTATCGNGAFTNAKSSSGLTAAFKDFEDKINESNEVFLAPSLPVNRNTRTKLGEWMYMAYFKPQGTGEWLGNIKKYAIREVYKDGIKTAELYGKDSATGEVDFDQPVGIENGRIMDTACSFWTTICDDGNDVLKGGVGSVLSDMPENSRNIYYYTGGTQKDLSASENKFSLTNAVLDVIDDVITAVLYFTQNWKLGAIIHSEPTIVHYTDQSVIFVGANDGMLHCFSDTDGKELWGFIPRGQKDNLAKINDSIHDYYVDGFSAISYGNLITGTKLFQPQLIIFGERRGGKNYYVLDINDYNRPKWKYQIDKDYLGTEELGESWSKPRVCTIATSTSGNMPDASSLQKVFMMAGGYDVNQDLPTPLTDTRGRAIFSVNTDSGTPAKFQVTHATMNSMKNCIVDINVTSPFRMNDGTEIATRVYAGDLGGSVFTFADDLSIVNNSEGDPTVKYKVPNGDFSLRNCLFKAQNKNIFYAPAVSKFENSYTEWVVFGTGDRENPLNTTTVNRIYAVKNTWLKSNLTETDLADVTDITTKETANAQIKSKDGWYFDLDIDVGEKLISPIIITQGYITFTTYAPSDGTESDDNPCDSGGASGQTFLYLFNLNNAVPIKDFNKDGTIDKVDRRVDDEVGTMAQPTLYGDTIITPTSIPVPTSINFDYFFWRQR